MKEFALARDAELPGDAERDGGHELGKRHGETPSEQRRTWTWGGRYFIYRPVLTSRVRRICSLRPRCDWTIATLRRRAVWAKS